MNRRSKGGFATRLREWVESATVRTCKFVIALAAVAGLTLVLLDVANFFLGSPNFGIQEQIVDGAVMATEAEILQLAGIEQGSNIWLVRPMDVAERVVKHPWVRSCKVEKHPPSKLQITIEERTPVVACLDAATGKTYGIDSSGYVLPSFQILFEDRQPNRAETARRQLATLPLVTGHEVESLTAGEVVDSPRLRKALAMYSRLTRTAHELAYSIDVLDLSHSGELWLVPRSGSGPIRISETRTENLDWKLSDIWSFLHESHIEPKYIDARFPDLGLALQLGHIPDREWLTMCKRFNANHP